MSRGPISSMPEPKRAGYRPGDVIGNKYRLLQLLGEGGMGSVWVAENVDLAANVALKLIRADVAESSANERFLSEARVSAQLRHAAITRVFDTGKTKHEEPYIVMELLEGETLGQRLARRGSIDPIELVQMLLPIIDALHSAHTHGVVHRDLKPDNIFVARTEGGIQPKLLDFGIAKLRGESAFKFSQTKLTQAGTLIGSPDYMSPEQARGEVDLDARSDIWALCVVAYECLVGRPPFQGDNYNALLWSIIHDEPVPITVFQAGDSELWRILKRGFAKDRKARWDSAKQLGETLAGWLESHGITEDICARSLHASWLPAERPTRPELTPFKDLGSPARPSSHAPLVAPPTVPIPLKQRSGHVGMWLLGAGFVTLLAALVFTRRDMLDIGSEAEARSRIPGDVTAAGPSLPTPAPRAPAPGALDTPSEPIPALPPPTLPPPEASEDEAVAAEPTPAGESGTTAGAESPSPAASAPEANEKQPKAAPASKRATRATREKAAPKRNAVKKAAEPRKRSSSKPGGRTVSDVEPVSEWDFGI